MKLQLDKEYSFSYFTRLNKLIKVIPYYGTNKTRNELKIVEVNDFQLSDIACISINSTDGFVVIDFINSLGVSFCRRLLKTMKQ